jgi:hypothetical protein
LAVLVDVPLNCLDRLTLASARVACQQQMQRPAWLAVLIRLERERKQRERQCLLTREREETDCVVSRRWHCQSDERRDGATVDRLHGSVRLCGPQDTRANGKAGAVSNDFQSVTNSSSAWRVLSAVIFRPPSVCCPHPCRKRACLQMSV